MLLCQNRLVHTRDLIGDATKLIHSVLVISLARTHKSLQEESSIQTARDWATSPILQMDFPRWTLLRS